MALYKREAMHGGGPEPYAPLAMLRPKLLDQWHGLSATQLEHALTVRLDFMGFTGFEPSDASFPDARTVCRFRNWLEPAKLDQMVLRGVNVQLEGQGLKVAGIRGEIMAELGVAPLSAHRFIAWSRNLVFWDTAGSTSPAQ